MATSFCCIYDVFLTKVIDPDLLELPYLSREQVLRHLLDVARSKFMRICKTDLAITDENTESFDNDLTDEEADILADGMVWAWYNTKLNHADMLKNFLSTKDYSMAAAPSNMLKEVRNTRDEAWKAFKRAMHVYSYAYGGIEDLRPQG